MHFYILSLLLLPLLYIYIAPVKHFDQIILLMEGEVVASGKHKELYETSPEYIQIYNSQFSTSHYEL